MFRSAFIFLILLTGIASADEDAVAKYRDYLPEQLLALSEEERHSSVPMMFSGAANLATSPAGELVMQSNLNMLMYDGFADFEGAKRAFQEDLGEEPTGDLTVWQIHTLGYRSSRVNMTSVSFFPLDFGGTMIENWAFLKGTVEIIDEKIAYPINHVDIECSRSRGTCDYRQIALTLPDENSWVQSYHVGEIADEVYQITRWEGQSIDAVPMNATGCRINQLSLNFETQEFFEIARNNTAGDCDTMLGGTIPRLEKPRVSRIVDGREIISAEFSAISEETFSFFSSEFRNRVETLIAENEGNK
ncbi:hypothetical protein PGB28_17160 [Primorskyibacter aestuariivivens]|uniref:hypothetical protein n=1 Tax=Primorskyibacter aestuariivivens TaxID=1888912 RepID=UPI002300AD6E|nr:hypothetical protein [Primorskyibacter aestuariivivens]MDA7430194.1 hypothetical protein [Primorskyibacter aestuariivivens]